MKLKTLKDIDACGTCHVEHSCNCPGYEKGKHLDNCELRTIYCIHSILKKEAIRHIRSCRGKEDFTTNNMCGFYYDEDRKNKKPRPVFCEVCEWIKYFFNITNEEIPEKKEKSK